MIDSIKIPRRPPYDGEDVTVEGLNKVNFFFGSNGTGKTSLCRLIDSECKSASSPYVIWTQGAPMPTYVFDRDFVEKNFRDYENVPGVFTMGAESVAAQDDIDRISAGLEKNRDSLGGIRANLVTAQKDAESIEDGLLGACWNVKNSLPASLKPAIKGFGNSKAKFRDKALVEYRKRAGAHPAIDKNELGDRMDTLFEGELSHVNLVPVIDTESLTKLEQDSILSVPIVGKEGLGISALINRLKNGDWVGKGRVYLRPADGKCPFCQQALPVGFEDEIEQFFDDSYRNNINELTRVKNLYEDKSQGVLDVLDGLLEGFDAFIDGSTLRAHLEEFRRLVSGNLGKLGEKESSPGLVVSLDSTAGVLDAISGLLDAANNKIETHNSLVDNRESERDRAISDAWDYISVQLGPLISDLLKRKEDNTKKLEGLKRREQNTQQFIYEQESQLRKAEQGLTNVRKTANDINGMLKRFGFDRFCLMVDESEKRYRIVRPNGDPAGASLSEGERSFLTFLYFYYLMGGSQAASGTKEKRIVVIDDPISSMDSDVLFITSSLVRNIAMEAREGSGPVEQLLILTHNVSFYREVTFAKGKKNEKASSYYTIRKTEHGSEVIINKENPICSTYELLWRNLFEERCSSLTAQNVARRIVENFFRFIGNTDISEIPDELTGDEQSAARAFLLWANSGSHNAFEDETDFNPNLSAESYRKILRLIFEKTGYEDHYHAMVGRMNSSSC